MRIVSIVGARPQFVKLAPVCRALARHNANGGPQIEDLIVHTGQHYDPGMSDVFFEELDIPRAGVDLGVGSGTHGAQTARMLEGIERLLLERRPDAVVVYGDTNSTVAGALAGLTMAGVLTFATECQAQRGGGLFPNRTFRRPFAARYEAAPSVAATPITATDPISRPEDLYIESPSYRNPPVRRPNDWRRDPSYFPAAPAYPKFYGGFHSSHFSNLGVPSGDIGFRGNGLYWAPW